MKLNETIVVTINGELRYVTCIETPNVKSSNCCVACSFCADPTYKRGRCFLDHPSAVSQEDRRKIGSCCEHEHGADAAVFIVSISPVLQTPTTK